MPVKITDLYNWSFDRTRAYRGYWITCQADGERQRPLYCLHQPDQDAPSLGSKSQADLVSTEIRGELAVLGNLLDFVFVSNVLSARRRQTAQALHSQLLAELGHEPYDLGLLAEHKKFVLIHLYEWAGLTEDSVFCQSVEALKKKKMVDKEERLQRAEALSKQFSWGQPWPGTEASVNDEATNQPSNATEKDEPWSWLHSSSLQPQDPSEQGGRMPKKSISEELLLVDSPTKRRPKKVQATCDTAPLPKKKLKKLKVSVVGEASKKKVNKNKVSAAEDVPKKRNKFQTAEDGPFLSNHKKTKTDPGDMEVPKKKKKRTIQTNESHEDLRKKRKVQVDDGGKMFSKTSRDNETNDKVVREKRTSKSIKPPKALKTEEKETFGLFDTSDEEEKEEAPPVASPKKTKVVHKGGHKTSSLKSLIGLVPVPRKKKGNESGTEGKSLLGSVPGKKAAEVRVPVPRKKPSSTPASKNVISIEQVSKAADDRRRKKILEILAKREDSKNSATATAAASTNDVIPQKAAKGRPWGEPAQQSTAPPVRQIYTLHGSKNSGRFDSHESESTRKHQKSTWGTPVQYPSKLQAPRVPQIYGNPGNQDTGTSTRVGNIGEKNRSSGSSLTNVYREAKKTISWGDPVEVPPKFPATRIPQIFPAPAEEQGIHSNISSNAILNGGGAPLSNSSTSEVGTGRVTTQEKNALAMERKPAFRQGSQDNENLPGGRGRGREMTMPAWKTRGSGYLSTHMIEGQAEISRRQTQGNGDARDVCVHSTAPAMGRYYPTRRIEEQAEAPRRYYQGTGIRGTQDNCVPSAGRGRERTMPAWMSRQPALQQNTAGSHHDEVSSDGRGRGRGRTLPAWMSSPTYSRPPVGNADGQVQQTPGPTTSSLETYDHVLAETRTLSTSEYSHSASSSGGHVAGLPSFASLGSAPSPPVRKLSTVAPGQPKPRNIG